MAIPGLTAYNGTIYMKTALWPGFNLRRCCHVVLVLSTMSVWLALADILQQGIRQSCESRGISHFFFFTAKQQGSLPPPSSPSSSSSTWAPFHPDEIATRLRSHIDLTVVSNHWGSSLFFPPPTPHPTWFCLLSREMEVYASTRLFCS